MSRVLIVDDNVLNLRLAQAVLVDAGFEVQTAMNADEALAAIAVARPALILMDLQLPVVSGYELTRQLKADPATRDIWIVACTAYAMQGDAERALAAGCDGYVTKPIDIDGLPVLISDCIARGCART